MAKLICSIACFCCLFFCNAGVLVILNWYYVYLFVCLFVFGVIFGNGGVFLKS